ncbi:hypothetical protein [Pelagicoccus albus]|uniref:Methyltransferase domain-containing protein n=1 Tax=Pelagicoccus albus TaxID=415222 RepID=A0A7X1E9E0_9BACT|nr:hypothetical protein [Pelagicoccus albus]MBC2605692.1 hypothetical protein [Pelagicoccus albus]
MSLHELSVQIERTDLPPHVEAFLKVADQSCDRFFEEGNNRRFPRFIPADYELVYSALLELQNNHHLLGNRFCEWGSGLGTATCLASMLGFEAYGLEIEQPLLERARQLAESNQIEANFLDQSFLPEGYHFFEMQGGRELGKPRDNHPPSYEDVEWTLEEVDIFYVYPWPEEQQATLDLFDSVAADGAYLICYFSEGEICIYRKELD